MPVTIAIEAKPVVIGGIDTGFDHLYLVRRATDAAGNVLAEQVIRGFLGNDESLEVQADIPLASSEDRRGSDSLAERRHTVLDLGGREPDDVWPLMVQHGQRVDASNLRYGFEADGFEFGGDVNSNTLIASALHAVGINLARVLPRGVTPGDVPQFNRLDAMFVNDALLGAERADSIFGGVGNDWIRGGIGNDRLFGESGNDTLAGNTGNDLLDGGVGADSMTGGDGNDDYRVDNAGDRVIETSTVAAGGNDLVRSTISFDLAGGSVRAGIEGLALLGAGNLTGIGNGLDNRLTGNAGANVLSGFAGDDVIRAGAGNDRLIGGVGDDILRGDAGRDLLQGAGGRDVLAGGADIDTFVFNSVSESRPGPAEHDTILDFGTADVIDLRRIDADLTASNNNVFELIGADAFTGAGQVRFEVVGGDTLVQANVDGDLAPELEIVLRGSTRVLVGDDFML
jgi:Ca2+-binding RTX toxin-like protein